MRQDKEFHLRRGRDTAGSDPDNLVGLIYGGFKVCSGSEFLFEETGSGFLHYGFERSRCFKVQRPGAVEIRFVRLIRLGCGGTPGQAKNTEARKGDERAE